MQPFPSFLNNSFLFFGVCGITFAFQGCGEKSRVAPPEPVLAERQDTVEPIPAYQKDVEVATDQDFLLGTHSVGKFVLQGPWREVSLSYGFDMVQGFGHCVDACCDGGFLLYKKGERERPLLTIGATPFDVEADEGKYARRKDLFYVNSDNCSGWYKTDDAAYFEVYSSEFRTPENIGVGSSLSEASRAYGTLFFHVGWIEEDANALYFTVSSFEDYRFVLDVEDYLGHWEEISMAGDQHHLKVSDFKKNATVQRILVGKF